MGDIEWPVPVRLVSGSEVSYGYEDEVVLLAPLRRLPPTMNGGGSTAMVDPPGSVLAMITYVICREVCVMEKASPEIDVPDARSRQSSADVALIDQWQTRMPKPMPTSWKATATLAAESWSIAVNTGHRETEATFFPAQPGLIHDSAPVRIEPTATGLVLHLETSPFFSAAPSTLDGVIVIPNTGAFMIHAPVIK
jgi:thiol:disulfide interchange protein DsbD